MIGTEWSIEVNEDQQRRNWALEEEFIVDFIGRIYNDIEAGHEQLSKIMSLHLNRIFQPNRDIGPYVRLRIFAEEADMQSIVDEVDNRLAVTNMERRTFQVRKLRNDWNSLGKEYGGSELRFVFLDHLDAVSRSAYRLLCYKQQGVDVQMVENALWAWTHMFFNAVRGFGVGVLECPQGVQVNIPDGFVFHTNI